MRIVGPLLAVLALVTACATADSGTDAGGASHSRNDLTVEADAGDGSPSQSWTLTCDGAADGTLPDPATACAHLQGMDEPFAPLPNGVACTEQFGGAQTAHVSGVWDGDPVDLELSRSDGCRIAQWDGLGPLLPIPVG